LKNYGVTNFLNFYILALKIH